MTAPDPHPATDRRGTDRRWTSRRALILHLVILIWVPGCALATWWQVGIALSGDRLGWIYTFMWPCFALFGLVLWWNLIHDDPDTVGARGLKQLQQQASPPSDTPAPDDAITRAEAEDAELAAYNAYLADLRRRPQTKTWRRH